MKYILPFLFALSLVSGCADPCKKTVCFNGGTCIEGDCICPPGFTGENCQTSTNGGGGGGGSQYGKATFWYDSYGSNATVYINGQSGQVTQYYSSYDPSCGSTGCANFTLPVGFYSYTASSTFSDWSGSIAVTNNGCVLVLLD